MLFITAGMGGGTGTGAAPVIARVAKEMGILTVGVVTKPFEWEGGRRMTNADAGLAELEANVDSLIVVLNEKLLEVLGDDITQDEAFAHANDVLKNAVGGIAEIINEYGHVNVDFEDVRTVMGEPGKAMMGTATASGPDRARIAAEQAVACPLLEGIDLSGAKGVLVLVTAARAASSCPSRAGHEHHQRLRFARCARDLRRRLRRQPGRRDPRDRGGHRPVARQRARQPSGGAGRLRTGTDNVAYPWWPWPAPLGGLAASGWRRRLRQHGGAQRVAHQPHGRHGRVDALCRAAWTIWRSRPSCASRLIRDPSGFAAQAAQAGRQRGGAALRGGRSFPAGFQRHSQLPLRPRQPH
jgi:cell division protein FtsZ